MSFSDVLTRNDAAYEPYIGLRPFEESERDRFFGRDREINILLDNIRFNRLTLLLAGSGVGKSSLLRAGVMPVLGADPDTELLYHNVWSGEPAKELKQAIAEHFRKKYRLAPFDEQFVRLPLKDMLRTCTMFSTGQQILLLDQFEEFFNYQRFREGFGDFVEELSAAVRDRGLPASFVFSMREDFALELNAFKEFLPGVFDNYFRLEKLTREQAGLAIEKPLERTGYSFAPQQGEHESLLDQVLDDLAKREQERQFGVQELLKLKELPLLVEPPHLQIVCRELWLHHRDEQVKQITHAAYEKAGGAGGILGVYFLREINQFSKKEQALASAAFDHLIGQRGTKVAHPLERLADLSSANTGTLKFLLEQVEKVERIWEQHFHDDTKELFGWDDNERHFFTELSAKLRKHVQLDIALLKKVLDKLQDVAVLRRQKRGEEFWYELYHDFFIDSIARWNLEYKEKQLQKKYYKTLAPLLFGGVMLAGIILKANYSGRYLQLSPKAIVSDRIEVYQGSLYWPDIFCQKGFRYETPFLRKQLESDQQFTKYVVRDPENLRGDSIALLWRSERFTPYIKNGLYNDAYELAAQSSQEATRKNSLRKHLPKALGVRVARTLEWAKKYLKKADDEENRRMAVEIFRLLGADDELRACLHDKKQFVRVRIAAAEAIGKMEGKFVADLIALLKDRDMLVRQAAAEILGQLDVSSAVPPLIELLREKDMPTPVRQAAAKSLGKLNAESAVKDMVHLLTEGDSRVRQVAVEVLVQLHTELAVPELIHLLNHRVPPTRLAAVNVLDKLKDVLGEQTEDVVSALIPLLDDHVSSVRQMAAKALGRFKVELSKRDFELAEKQLSDLLKDKEASVRQAAVEALGNLFVKSSVKELPFLLLDDDTGVRQAAAEALRKIDAKLAVSKLMHLLVTGDSKSRHMAGDVLGSLPVELTEPELSSLLENQIPSIRRIAAAVLGRLNIKEAIPVLKSLLTDQVSFVRQAAAEALGKMHAKGAEPDLVNLLEDKEALVRQAAVEALGKLDVGSTTVSELIKCHEDWEPSVRQAVAESFGKLNFSEENKKNRMLVAKCLVHLLSDENEGVQAAVEKSLIKSCSTQLGCCSVENDLIKLMNHELSQVRRSAAKILGKLNINKAIPGLTRLLKDEVWAVRKQAAESLGDLDAKSAISDLVRLLDDEEMWQVKDSVIKSLGNLHAVSAVSKLTGFLSHEFWQIRSSAVDALEKLHADWAVPDLLSLLDDQDERVRSFVVRALGNLNAEFAVPQLIPLLDERDPTNQTVGMTAYYVTRALAELNTASAIPALTSLMEKSSQSTQWVAVEALGKLGAKSISDKLIKRLKDSELSIQRVAARALARVNNRSSVLVEWQKQAIKDLEEKIVPSTSQGGRGEAADALGYIFTDQSVTLLERLIDKEGGLDNEVLTSAVTSVGVIGEYRPDLVQGQVQRLINLIHAPDLELVQAAITALGHLLVSHRQERMGDFSEMNQKIRGELKSIIEDSVRKQDVRVAAIDALGAANHPENAEKLHELLVELDNFKDETLRYRCLYRLGRMEYAFVYLGYVKNELERLEEEKAVWRKERDSEEQEVTSDESEGKDNTWKKENWEYLLGNSLARINPEEHGIELLGHSLYQVRQGAVRALAGKVASAGKTGAGVNLIGKIIQAHQAFDLDDLPSPFPFAAFQAIDLALWNLEYAGKKDDLEKLREILKTVPEKSNIPGQEGAIKERLEWTIKRLGENFARNTEQGATE
ncbi:MAG: HEAT repeat domain-containing protein [Candidatus Electrothrix scaldis]|nr:MAG: HEAT repeat domain-containing protein [Candidatus Electrothrix sp. GW3-3]